MAMAKNSPTPNSQQASTEYTKRDGSDGDGALADQIALVTGAGRGIGAATACALARRGAHIILTARSSDELENTEDAIHQQGGTATIAPLDLTEPQAIARLAQAVSGRWGHLDCMVMNAAMLGALAPVAVIDSLEFNRLMTLNLLAQQALIANFDGLLRAATAGKLIAVTSSVARHPRAFWGAYGASKAAFEILLSSYGEEVRAMSPLRTAIVDPGATRTRMRSAAYPGEDPTQVKDPAVIGEAIANLVEQGFDSTYFLRIA